MNHTFRDASEVDTIEKLEEEVEKVLLMADKGLMRMVAATVTSNRLGLDPVWLMIVGPSASGKSECLNSTLGLKFTHPISDLTANTFASGFNKPGKEVSLLLQIQNGIMVFKDFTSILSKNKEEKKEILAQLREIFDGSYVKKTGTGEEINWKGKIGAIAGATEIIYRSLEEMSAMGDRFVMYSVMQPDRMMVARRAMKNAKNIEASRIHMQECFTNYINHVVANLEEIPELDENTSEELLKVADFATRVRSAVLTDFKTGMIDFVPSVEMPMRVVGQLTVLASAFLAMELSNPNLKRDDPIHKGVLPQSYMSLLYKTAFDSIPRSRRDVIAPLAEYRDGATTAGVAATIHLPTPAAGKYLSQIAALGVCSRTKKGGTHGDVWVIKEEYRDIVIKLLGLTLKDGCLMGDGFSKDNQDGESFGDESFSLDQVDSLDWD